MLLVHILFISFVLFQGVVEFVCIDGSYGYFNLNGGMSCHIVGVRPHNFAHRITVNSNCEIFGYYLAEFAVIDQVRQI